MKIEAVHDSHALMCEGSGTGSAPSRLKGSPELLKAKVLLCVLLKVLLYADARAKLLWKHSSKSCCIALNASCPGQKSNQSASNSMCQHHAGPGELLQAA